MWLRFSSYLLSIRSTRKNTAHNRSVYVIGAPWRDNWVTKEAVLWLAPRPAPAPAGDSLLVSRFLPTRE